MIIKQIGSDYKVNYSNVAPLKTKPQVVTSPFVSSSPPPSISFCGAVKTRAMSGVQQKFIPNSKTRLGANYNSKTRKVDFSVASENATKVFLCVFDDPDSAQARLTVPMERDGKIWNASVPMKELGSKDSPVYYGYRAFGPNWEYTDDFFNEDGSIKNPEAGFKSIVDEQNNTFNPNKIAYDPTGRELSHLPHQNEDGIPAFFSLNNTFEDNAQIAPKTVFKIDKPAPITKGSGRKLTDQVIGEVHIKDLSINEPVEAPGTYKGAGQTAKKVKEAGVSMVEFLPLQEFDEKEGYDGNYWGYMTLGYFAPAKKYSSDKSPLGAMKEFREMIDAFHKEGVDVCMDVVYNHTGEAGTIGDEKENRKQMSFSLLDNKMYYKGADGAYNNSTGCGNDINAGNDEVIEMIADSVAFWARQGVDAFRFDLAVGLMDKDTSEKTYYDPKDSAIGKLKEKLESKGIKVKNPNEEGPGINLIAEPWTCCGEFSHQLGRFPDEWAEWNDVFREFSRRLSTNPFDTTPSELRQALEGTPYRFRAKNKSVNYSYSHDGYNLLDYNNLSEYGSDKKRVETEMKKQIALTLLAKGTPMLQVGDILAHSKGGNPNTYCNDDETNYLDFSKVEKEDFASRIYDFTKTMVDFRKNHQNESYIRYYKPDGSIAESSDGSYWGNKESNILCYKIGGEKPAFVSISSDANAFDVKLPRPSTGKQWYRVCDTGFEDSCSVKGQKVKDKFISQPYAVAIFEER